MNNKICVYAISKNESKYVKKWLDSMEEADYIVVLDTGSTDGTYEMLKEDPRVTRVERRIITPWRFDIARNESLKLVPEDANILYCTDLDEILIEGWAEILRNNWVEEEHDRGYYKYAWSHSPSGDPEVIYWYDKIHNRNYEWEFPVHETLKLKDGCTAKHNLVLDENKIFLHHYPDPAKSRSSYLELLELRAKENPNSYTSKYYLGREYSFYNRNEEAIAKYREIIDTPNNDFIGDSRLMLAHCYTCLGRCYERLENYDDALKYYSKAMVIKPEYRDPYINSATIYLNLKRYRFAIAMIEDALDNTTRFNSWIEDGQGWTDRPYDILGVSYYYLGDKEKAKTNMELALKFNPEDKRLQENLKFIN